MKLNIHPRAACGIFTILWFSIFLLFYKVMKIGFDSPFYIIFFLIGFIPLNLIDSYFRNRNQDPRDESIYYDDTFQDNLFEEKEIDKRRE